MKTGTNDKRFKRLLAIAQVCALIGSVQAKSDLSLFYREPARKWEEALPLGNGRLGAMVYGGVAQEHIQFNEETLWTGKPRYYARQGAHQHLGRIRQLLFAGKQGEAQNLMAEAFMSVPRSLMAYQPFGDLIIDLPDGFHQLCQFSGCHWQSRTPSQPGPEDLCWTQLRPGEREAHQGLNSSTTCSARPSILSVRSRAGSIPTSLMRIRPFRSMAISVGLPAWWNCLSRVIWTESICCRPCLMRCPADMYPAYVPGGDSI